MQHISLLAYLPKNSRKNHCIRTSFSDKITQGKNEPIPVMTMLLSLKTKLKLNKTQEILMAKHAAIARFAYIGV
ncbi:helix-turn-helix domain-containing protein [Anabaena sp. FACHB-1237]|uniref:helix-turn-helix domain-containing protein n=1 Tax=Anabaena sp. FACHB-1237 TaxID=2692769 RepID=UPI0028C472A7|nr:helix-turn-helix domain-containing protein [Anabaena sp. FACHB-1237]